MKPAVMFLIALVLFGCRQEPKPLKDTASAIDPGHGGKDSGTWRMLGDDSTKIVTEDEYAYDISLRIRRRIMKMGGIASLTVQGDTLIRDYSSDEILENNHDETVVNNPDSVADGTSWSLVDRLVAAVTFHDSFGDKDQTWTSVHIDNLEPTKDTVCGVRIIYGKGSLEYAEALARAFGKLHLLRDSLSVVPNGSPAIDKRLLVLQDRGNPIKEKVLVELGNIRCDSDFNKILSPVGRELYALAIARAIADLHSNHVHNSQ